MPVRQTADATGLSDASRGNSFVPEIGEAMSTLFLTQLWRSHIEPYQRVTWFLCEAIEREQRLNVQAMLESATCFPGWFSPVRRSAAEKQRVSGRERVGDGRTEPARRAGDEGGRHAGHPTDCDH